MLLSRRLLLIANKKTPGSKRACTHQVQLMPAKIPMDMVNMAGAETGTDMTAVSPLIPTGRMGTDTTATETGTTAETAVEIAAGIETDPEASLTIAAVGMDPGHRW